MCYVFWPVWNLRILTTSLVKIQESTAVKIKKQTKQRMSHMSPSSVNQKITQGRTSRAPTQVAWSKELHLLLCLMKYSLLLSTSKVLRQVSRERRYSSTKLSKILSELCICKMSKQKSWYHSAANLKCSSWNTDQWLKRFLESNVYSCYRNSTLHHAAHWSTEFHQTINNKWIQ